MEPAQHYIQGRFDLYCPLFRELSPPVPNECRRMFSINGHLAPGYILAPPDKSEPSKQTVDDLLACLDDVDMAESCAKPPEKSREEQSKSVAKGKHIPTR